MSAPLSNGPERQSFTCGPGNHCDRAIGSCMWRCGRRGVPVLWIGDIASSGMHAPLYACDDCTAGLDALVWAWARHRDGLAPPDTAVDGCGCG
ncbi:hypothetical protein ACFW9F_02960 [Streptomyces sp. NPDC059506]|uniref:hypothetical protein n=1 Tax=unclassified Streptomyces TaxID=2593676 RepID=UPI000CB0C523|nr:MULTISPECIES: hypothetical protein [unclassified Streptomyces]MCZ2523751.1 hypothetical protein [Streptomyces sp. HB2AG]PLW71689.1 hypothetical protein C0036_16515 [Streptomyces sp. DJ]QMV22383.1 hypothetical protein GQS52_11915 [Streptomyces sp. SCUT-3]